MMRRAKPGPPLDADAAVLSVMRQLSIQHEVIMAAPAFPEARVLEYLGLTRRLYALEFYRKTGEWRP